MLTEPVKGRPDICNPRPPVKEYAPQGKCPTKGEAHHADGIGLGAEQQRRKPPEQGEGPGLADQRDRQRDAALSTQHREQEEQHDFPKDEGAHQPPRDELSNRQSDDRRGDVQAVNEWIQDGTEWARLVQFASQVPVEPISDSGDDEEKERPYICLHRQDQPEEERDPEQAEETQRIGNRPNAGLGSSNALHGAPSPRATASTIS